MLPPASQPATAPPLRDKTITIPRTVFRTLPPPPPKQGHRDSVTSVAISPDGATLVSGSADRTVRVWDAASGECRAVLEVGPTDSQGGEVGRCVCASVCAH